MDKTKLNNILKIREELGISSEEIALIGGVSQSEVTRVESGKRIPNQKVMMKISKGLGKPTHEVFNLDWENVEL